MFTITAPRAAWLGRTFSFLRHLLVMTLAMLLGMAAYGLWSAAASRGLVSISPSCSRSVWRRA